MYTELLVIDTGFQARNSDLQDRKSDWTSFFRIVPASDGALVTGGVTWRAILGYARLGYVSLLVPNRIGCTRGVLVLPPSVRHLANTSLALNSTRRHL